MNPIDQAIARTERHLERLDELAKRAAHCATVTRSSMKRAEALAVLGMAAQEILNSQNLLNGLKNIRHRPEFSARPRMLKAFPKARTRRTA